MPLGEKQYLWDEVEVADVLRKAVDSVEAVELPEDLRVSAFQYACQLHSQCQVIAGALTVPGHVLQ